MVRPRRAEQYLPKEDATPQRDARLINPYLPVVASRRCPSRFAGPSCDASEVRLRKKLTKRNCPQAVVPMRWVNERDRAGWNSDRPDFTSSKRFVKTYLRLLMSLIIGLTGGIGSGKTTLQNSLPLLGADVDDTERSRMSSPSHRAPRFRLYGNF